MCNITLVTLFTLVAMATAKSHQISSKSLRKQDLKKSTALAFSFSIAWGLGRGNIYVQHYLGNFIYIGCHGNSQISPNLIESEIGVGHREYLCLCEYLCHVSSNTTNEFVLSVGFVQYSVYVNTVYFICAFRGFLHRLRFTHL
jgi:hypothetical protein